jgi:inorganic pyrophosphatase
VYKDLENKTVDVGGWGDVDEAYKIIKICSDRFDQIENKPEGIVFLYKYPDVKQKKSNIL